MNDSMIDSMIDSVVDSVVDSIRCLILWADSITTSMADYKWIL